jgi:hypothetical protein
MSKKKQAIIPEQIHLFSIKVFQGSLKSSEAFLEAPQRMEGFEFGLARDLAHNPEEGLTRLRLYFSLDARDAEGEALGLKAEYGIEFQFRVDGFSDFITLKNEEVRIDANLGATLIGIAYSTARGIILQRLEGTFFGGVILPVIDPRKLLLQDQPDTQAGMVQDRE